MRRRADLLFVAAAILASATPAQAADRQSISIAPGRLGEAAIALGRQTGASIGMSDQALAGLATRGVEGRLTVEAALKRLLKGTRATARRIDARTWRIERMRITSAPAASPPPPAAPAPAPDAPPAEIIVTASKRDTPLPRYAGMVEALDNGVFTSAQAASGTATLLARIASLSSTHAGNGRNKLFIRAIADSGVAGPTQATTGQYLGDMRLNYAAPDPDLKLYDVGRVEVLEGPQGTLYGAGSLGGIIRIMPNAPNLGDYGGQVSAGLSATQHGDPGGDLSATLNLPIVAEKLALRVVGYGVQEGGYIDDVNRGEDDVNRVRTWGGRAALRFAPDENWTIDLNGVYQHIDGDDAQYATGQSAGCNGLRPCRNPISPTICSPTCGSSGSGTACASSPPPAMSAMNWPKAMTPPSPAARPRCSARITRSTSSRPKIGWCATSTMASAGYWARPICKARPTSTGR